MNILSFFVFGVPAIALVVQLLLCFKVKGLFFRLVPMLFVAIDLLTVLLLEFYAGWRIPGAYVNILLPRFAAVGLGWLIWSICKRR